MPQSFDGKLDYRSWDEAPDDWSYLGPFASNAERLTQQALSVAFMDSAEIQEYVRPNLPQVDLFPQKFGQMEYQDRQPTVVDIIGKSRLLPTPAASWYSGTAAGMLGGSRYSTNSLGSL